MVTNIKVIKSQQLLKKEPRRTVAKFDKVSREQLVSDVLSEAKVLGVPQGTAKVIAEKVYDDLKPWLDQRGAITRADLNREVAKKVKKYHADLSYLYENRGKII